jgi:hypothetical protein
MVQVVKDPRFLGKSIANLALSIRNYRPISPHFKAVLVVKNA